MGPTPRVPESASELVLPWIVRLRYTMAIVQIATVLIANRFFDPDLPTVALTIAPGIVALSNLWIRRFPLSKTAFARIFVLDILCLTAELLLAGGATNPFSLLYLVHITLAATILTRRQTWLLAGLSTLCFASLFWKYRPITILEVHRPTEGSSLHLLGMWISFAVAAFLVALFSARISDLLRERESTLLKMHTELANKDRLASLVTLAAGAAHELGTPLATIAVVAREMERYATLTSSMPDLAEDSRLIRTEVDRCRAILERMSSEGAEPTGEAMESVPVAELLSTVRSQFYTSLAVDCDDTIGRSVSLRVPRHAVEQAIIALVKNAIEASSTSLPVTLRAFLKGNTMQFVVTDRGSGMTAETLRHVTEPFFTTKGAGKGMGLGTFLVRTLAERLGGSLNYSSAPGTGTTATFELPVALNASAAGRSRT